MKYKSINLREIPKSLDLKITTELVDYSVAIGRIQNGESKSFQPLGSGTLVRKRDRFGILTAHHCLHAVNPEVALGNQNADTLICFLKGEHSVVIESHEVYETPLAFPEGNRYGEYGPDLTFIEIPNGPRLSSFKATSSFWNLDRNPAVILRDFGSPGHVLVNAGFPKAYYRTQLTDEAVFHDIKFMSFISAIADGDIEIKSGWDYIRSSCNYDFAKDLPRSFNGLSGGGIWSVRIKYTEKTEEWDVMDFTLIGVTFFQIEIENKRIDLRGHFIQSIYTTAWN